MLLPEKSLDPSLHLTKWEINKLEFRLALSRISTITDFVGLQLLSTTSQKSGNRAFVSFIYAHRNHVYPAKSLRDADKSYHLQIEFGSWENKK